MQLSMLHRIAYYYIRINEGLSRIKNCVFVKYDELVCNPLMSIDKVVNMFGLSYGSKTHEIIKNIKLREFDRKEKFLDHLEPDIREKVLNCSLLV